MYPNMISGTFSSSHRWLIDNLCFSGWRGCGRPVSSGLFFHLHQLFVDVGGQLGIFLYVSIVQHNVS